MNRIRMLTPTQTVLSMWGGIKDIHWHPSETKILISARDNSSLWIAIPGSKALTRIETHQKSMTQSWWNHHGTNIISTSNDGIVNVWDNDYRLISTYYPTYPDIHMAAWAPNDQILLIGSSLSLKSHSITMYDPYGKIVVPPIEHIYYAAWHPQEMLLIVLREFSNGYHLELLNSHGMSIRSFDTPFDMPQLPWTPYWSFDGQYIAILSDTNNVLIWHIEGAFLGKLPFDPRWSWKHCISWHPSKPIIAIPYKTTIQLWKNMQLYKILEGHEQEICGVAWNPQGTLLASAASDRVIRLWNEAGICIAILKGHTDAVMDVGWSFDGGFLASVSRSFETFFWDMSNILEELGSI